jgi:class 3 adenylate cyclase/tetratricopeptide (TPR) repeat protein
MKCPRCEHENRLGAKFCEECAAPLARACANCGAELSPTAKFCSECAHPAGQAAASAPQRFGPPETYTPKHLVEKILTSKAALEGERKQVTVLFADLKGSMELLADRDPEQARKILDPVLERMMEAVHRYEGTVNQVLGDGIMALFGAPLAREDHAVRACYAALRMQDTFKRYAEEVHRTQGIPLQIRVGLNSGDVVVRSIGSDLHMDYTAVGQTTHLAARMEQMAMPGSILLAPETLGLAEGYVTVKALGPMPVKGVPTPVEVYELTGAATVRSRLQATAARGLTRFVGRQAELDQLRQAMELASTGRGQVVAVVGEPGVGKSRLFWEFTHSHRTQGWLIVESSSVSYGKATAFLPIIDLLRAYFQIEMRDDARKIREKATGKLLSLDRALEPCLPALLWLLDVAVDDAQWQRLDPPQRRQQVLDGIKRLLVRESQAQPLLLVFEDLHWIDAQTQALLDSLVESLPAARLLLLVNYRPEYQHGWGSKTCYRQLRIDPLPPEGAEELLEALLGDDPGLEPLKHLLIERTEGNPFFLEESVRTLVETKVLVGERGAYRAVSEAHTLQIPVTAQAILAARIDRLAPEHKWLLQAASVIGKDVPFALLQGITEEPEEALRRGLASLVSAEFLYEARLFPDLEYTFKHALTHDVAYGGLLQERRRALHTKIAATMEAIYADRLAEHVERLADHALRGEVWDKAVTYLRQAGAKAAARSSNREALAYFEAAMTALPHLPETRATLEQAIDLRFDLRNSLHTLAAFGRIDGLLHEAERLATVLNDQRRLGWVSAYRSGHHVHTGGHVTDVSAFAQRVEAIGETLCDRPLQVAARYYSLLACHLAGDYRGAEQGGRRLMDSLAGDQTLERFGLAVLPAVHSRAYLARTLAEQGVFEEADAHGLEAMRIAQTLDHPFSVLWACLGQAYVDSTRGEVGEAARLLERGLALCHQWNITTYVPVTMAPLGHAYARSGRIGEGISLLQQALALYESAGIGFFHSISVAHLGEAYLLADRVEDARGCAERSETLARTRGERGYEVYAWRLLGEVATLAVPPRVAEAEVWYGQALASAEDLGMRPLAAHCHFGLGTLYQRTGQQQEAQRHLTTATAMYREMRMAFWLEQAETKMSMLT